MRQDERVHGGIDRTSARAAAVRVDDVLDLSVNLNPFGPPPALLEAVRSASLVHYPDPHAFAARSAWANVLQVAPDQIAVGHGAADLLWAIVRAFVAPSDRVVVAEPTFSEIRAAAAHARVDRVLPPALALDFGLLAERARGARLLYLCAPNNPTGEGISVARIAELADALPDTLCVVDQSFLSLSDLAHELTRSLPENVIALRSLTKDFALAGLRIGYLVADARLVTRIESARPTWATGAPALAAIAAAAEQGDFVAESWQRMRAGREHLREALLARGLHVISGVAGFVLVEVDDAARVTEKLLARGVLVRDCTSFGLPRHVRVAARAPSDTARLLSALEAP